MKKIIFFSLILAIACESNQSSFEDTSFDKSSFRKIQVGAKYDSILNALVKDVELNESKPNDESSWENYFKSCENLARQYRIGSNVSAADSIIALASNKGAKILGSESKLLMGLQNQKGFNLISSYSYDEAIILLERLSKQLDDSSSEIQIVNLLGLASARVNRYYRDYNTMDSDTAYMLLTQAMTKLNSQHSKRIYNEIQLKLADVHMQYGELDSAYFLLNLIIENVEATDYQKTISSFILYEWARAIGDFQELLLNAEETVKYGEMSLPKYSGLLSSIYLRASYANERHGDLDRALEYSKKANRINKVNNNRTGFVANTLNQGNIYQRMGKKNQAKTTYYEALRIAYEENFLYNIYSIHNDLGVFFGSLNQLDSAIYHYKKSIEIKKESLGNKHEYIALSKMGLAEIYELKQDYKNSEIILKEAYQMLTEINPQNEILITSALTQLGELLLKRKDYEQSIICFQKAIQIQQPIYDVDNIEAQPDLDMGFISELQLGYTLASKGFTLQKICEDKGGHYCLAADNTYYTATKLLDKIRGDMFQNRSKGYIAGIAKDIYKGAIQHKIYEYQRTNSSQLLQEAFDIAEKSKSVLLNESVKESDAQIAANIAAEDLEKEEALQANITEIEKQYFEEQKKEVQDKSLIDEIENERFELKRQYEQFIEYLETTYPAYYQLKYNISTIPLQKVGDVLPDENTALLEYFVSDSTIYAFVVQDDYAEVTEIPRDFPLEEWIEQVRNSTYTYRIKQMRDESKELAYADTLIQRSHQLYKKLIAPIIEQHELPEKIIIVPDGILAYLPFEILIKKLPEDNTYFGTHSYLLNDYQISYSYSATLLQEMQRKQSKASNNSVLAFAPSFPDKKRIEIKNEPNKRLIASADIQIDLNEEMNSVRSGFDTLRNNVPEVNGIKQIVGTDTYTESEASKAKFIAEASDYKVLHLATHGKSNDEAGDFAHLAFSIAEGDSSTQNLLYNRDLYNLKLNADMVVLSACETGIGEIQKGEGVISLARGFSYAGAKSIITTLWSVDDKKTQELMQSFYHYLKQGKSKDAALRQAKLDFIDEHFHKAHPFYWAAFVPIGDMSAIEINSGYNWWVYGVGGVLLFGLISFIFQKRA